MKDFDIGRGVPMEFRILGPLDVVEAAQGLDLRGDRQRVVLAMLLLSANNAVSVDRLLEAIYGEDLPSTARSQLHVSISTLRRVLAASDGNANIATRTHGYVLHVENDQLDALRFADLLTTARRARESGQRDKAIACYRDALRLWRGPALEGLDSQLVRAAASRLDEHRITARETLIDLELESGRHHEVVGELEELVAKFPLRERLHAQLMLALYRCGRVPHALDAYRQARHVMVDELGIEPSKRLQQLQHAILNADPALELATGLPGLPLAGRQPVNLLPTDIGDFTGRSAEVGQVRRHLTRTAAHDATSAVPVAVVTGKPGVGKTSIAVHAAYGIADQFPDGQLFADLHGGDAHPVSPLQVLERFLRVLGVPGSRIPDDLDGRVEVYRNVLNDRKMLVVLDDVAGENQACPLLPGSGLCGVIITSRRWLTGLPGAVHVEADIFDRGTSIELLANIVGERRVLAEPDEAAKVATYCGSLPLALRIAGARLSARPHWSVRQFAGRLADETRRLDELRHGAMGIRPSISMSYEGASADARRFFRRLALFDQPSFSVWQSAALVNRPVTEVEDLLDDLVGAQLMEVTGTGTGAHTHYRFHDLIRIFARERLAAEEPSAERKAALKRALGALLYLAEQANHRYYGGDYFGLHSDAPRWPLPGRAVEQVVADPLSWYDLESAALVSGVRQAAQAGLVDLSWSLALNAVTLFESRNYLDDWQETHDIALAAAKRAGHVRGQAAMLYSMGSLHLARQRFEPARQVLAAAKRLFREMDDSQGTALVLRHLAYTDRLCGQLDDAGQRYGQALALFRKTGDLVAEASVLYGLAQVERERNKPGCAVHLLSTSLRLCRAAQCVRVEAQVLHRLGTCHLDAGNLDSAICNFEQALAKTREVGDLAGEAYALGGIGAAHIRRGQFGCARQMLERALELVTAIGDRLSEGRIFLGLGELAIATGDAGQAVLLGRQAADRFLALGTLPDQARALALLEQGYAARGDDDAAAAAAAEGGALRAKLLGDAPIP